MTTRTLRRCSCCEVNLLFEDKATGILVCPDCDLIEAEPRVLIDREGVYTDAVSDTYPITHCIRGCGSRLTIADRGTVCRQCVLGEWNR